MLRNLSFVVRTFAVAALLLAPALAAAQTSPGEPAPAPADDPGLLSVVPEPDAVFVQRTADFPELGDTLVTLVLNAEEIQRIKEATGRYDLIAVGPEDQQVVFRDDGREGDLAAGDFEFTGIATIEPQEVADRSETDTTSTNRGTNRNVPLFENRAAIGETTVEPFKAAAFEAGEQVELTRALALSSNETALEAEGEDDNPHGETGGLRVAVDAAHVPGTNQFQDRVLMIRDPLVVQDPARTWDPCTGGTRMGVWTFGHLATAMANQRASGIHPGDLVETWLNEWLTSPQTINGFNVPTRAAMQALIDDWHNASPGPQLDVSIAPFRLLAINPRLDLRTTVGGVGGYGAAASGAFLDAGEARFTFGVVLPEHFEKSRNEWILAPDIGNGCLAARFSVIFEYRVPKCKCKDVRNWARQWRELDNFVPGSNAYNGRLERLTRTFTDANRNPARPNRNAIGQVRSNEISLEDPWEIREFQLKTMPFSLLLETTTADTPNDHFARFNPGPPPPQPLVFGNFVNDVFNGVAGLSVPLIYPLGSNRNFLGANPQTISPANTWWGANNILAAALPTRHQVSLGTCNGCHARETDTVFQHIESFHPIPPAVPISGFLQGIHVTDPADGTVRSFDDLANRETDINAVANMICARFRPIRVRPIARLPIPIGPLTSQGLEVQSAAATVEITTDPDAAPLSLAPEDLLRDPVEQVH